MTDVHAYDGPVIIVTVRQWFDRVNGNSYFTARWRQVCPRPDTDGVTVRTGTVPFTYGHGDGTVRHEVEASMRDAGYTVTGCTFLLETVNVRRRADLHQEG